MRIQTERHYKGIWHCIQETYRTEKVSTSHQLLIHVMDGFLFQRSRAALAWGGQAAVIQALAGKRVRMNFSFATDL